MYLDRPVVTSHHDLWIYHSTGHSRFPFDNSRSTVKTINNLLVDSRLIGRLHDDRFAMVASSLLHIAMVNAKQRERHVP